MTITSHLVIRSHQHLPTPHRGGSLTQQCAGSVIWRPKNIYIILVYILNINLPVHRIGKTSTRGPRHYNRSFNLNSIAPNYDSVAPDMASLQQLLRQNSNLQQTQRNLIGYRQLTYHNDINYSLSTVPLRRKQGHWCSDTLIWIPFLKKFEFQIIIGNSKSSKLTAQSSALGSSNMSNYVASRSTASASSMAHR